MQWRSDASLLAGYSMEEQQRLLLGAADMSLQHGFGNELGMKHQASSPAALRGTPRGRAAPPLVCQVHGCNASLQSLKEYYQR